MSYNTAEIIEKFIEVHGNRYDYSETIYINILTKVKIICSEHGPFFTVARSHYSGSGCPKCASDIRGFKCRFTQDMTIVDFLNVHGNRYDYSEMKYRNNKTKVKIICSEHGAFYQTPCEHKRGSGCPSCAKNGFNLNSPAILYYIKIKMFNLYKIGVTNNSVETRWKNDPGKIEIIRMIPFEDGKLCQQVEQLILKRYKHMKYYGDPILTSGNTEIFEGNVLGWY